MPIAHRSALSITLSLFLPLIAVPAKAAPPVQINGQPVVILKRAATSNGTKPEFLSATVLPGRGMNLLQITASIPGKGVIDVFATPSIDKVAQALSNDKFGNMSFSTFEVRFWSPTPIAFAERWRRTPRHSRLTGTVKSWFCRQTGAATIQARNDTPFTDSS